MMNRICHSRGLSLIEVLVSLVILSVGLLGLAGLQLSGLRSVNNASFYTQGTLAVNDLVERMRVNKTAVNNNKFAAINSTSIDCTSVPAPYCSEYHNGSSNVAALPCTPDQLADHDLFVWFCGTNSGGAGVSDTFPNATFTIACNDSFTTDTDTCTDSSPHTLTLTWAELNPNRANGANTVSKTIAMMVQP